MEITVVLKDKKEATLSFSPGSTLLDVLRAHNITISAHCAGAGICGSCLVLCDPPESADLSEREPQEEALLEAFQQEKGGRLACQFVLTEPCDGLKIALL
jgi:ferredoxin